MNTVTSTHAGTSAQSRLGPLLLAGALGFLVVWVAGFMPMEAVHNAAHDLRHSLAFPCH